MSAEDGFVVGLTRLVNHGGVGCRFNLLLVSEGYRESQLDAFADHCDAFLDALFTTPPLDEFTRAFNVWRLDVASDESGIDRTGIQRDTYFDGRAEGRALHVYHPLVEEEAAAYVPEYHHVLVIVNHDAHGGLHHPGTNVSTVSVGGPDWPDTAIHELGHGIFQLADEYGYRHFCREDIYHQWTGSEPVEVNVTAETDRAAIKWGDLIGASTPVPTETNPDCTRCRETQPPPVPGPVGLFEGARYYKCGLHRPQHSCRMRVRVPWFCRVCQRQIRHVMRPFLPGCEMWAFDPMGPIPCGWVAFVLWPLWLVVALLGLFSPTLACSARRIRFRIEHCREGNDDPCREV